MDLDSKLHNMTTLITTTTPQGVAQGSGFFYSVEGQPDPNHPPGSPDSEGNRYRWIPIEVWVITNRHVVMLREESTGAETRPSSITVHARRLSPSGQLRWAPITIPGDNIGERVRLHPNKLVDVAAINISELFGQERELHKDQFTYLSPFLLNRGLLPVNNKEIRVEASSDVLVVGYPRGFYDDVNLFPIIKSGIVASRWGVGFKGMPCFLIDAKLFPGSSGSVVISKPVDMVLKDGQLLHLKDDEKAFSLLGVYSGTPHTWSETVMAGDLEFGTVQEHDLGVVWHADVIEEIIGAGVAPE